MGDDLSGSAASRPQFDRLNATVERQRSTELAIGAGDGDCVLPSPTASLEGGRGCYHTPDGDELWTLLLAIAAHQFAGKALDHRAAGRDSRRLKSAVKAQAHLESQLDIRKSACAYLELVLEEILDRLPPQNRIMVKLRLDCCEVAEVARLTRRSRRTVERILHESHLELASFLQEED
jgi:RNA polymerase sigma-70 factor, ECF subfamily